jgi:hypothetical protein
MDKKKFTPWGVSFSSLALVAGMMGYLGITHIDTSSQTNTVAQTQATTQSSTQSGLSISLATNSLLIIAVLSNLLRLRGSTEVSIQLPGEPDIKEKLRI